MREIENIKEAGSRAVGLRILRGSNTGSSYTSDFSAEGIRHMVKSARGAGRYHHRGSARGPARSGRISARISGDLELYSADVADAGNAAQDRARAKRAEKPRFRADPRIVNSEGASFDTHLGRHVFANSLRLRGRIPHQLLRLERRPGGARRRIDGARLLVHHRPQLSRPRSPPKTSGARPRRARCAGSIR